jgi:hypothetical protein
MTIQDIKRGHFKNVEGEGLTELIDEYFGIRPEQDGEGWYHIDFGALKPLSVRILSKSELEVLTTSNPDVEPDVASDTIRRYNKFLEAATGFNSKQRSKRLQKKAKEGKL